jgi:hypothetical protein
LSQERQLRAYLNVEECAINRIDEGFILTATLKNGGQTPAYQAKIMGESFGAEYPLAIERSSSRLLMVSNSPVGRADDQLRLSYPCR